MAGAAGEPETDPRSTAGYATPHSVERSDVGTPPGSTTVEIDLRPDDDGNTVLKLVHRGLDEAGATVHHCECVGGLAAPRTPSHGPP